MQKIVALLLVLCVFAGCGTLPKCGILPKEDRARVREFNAINRLSADDIEFIKRLGLDPNHLSEKDKAHIMREAEVVARSYAF